jgi:predicted nucleotidyltransferase
MSVRHSINVNTRRQLWADCGGYCQNPLCNKYLLAEVDNETVSLANMAHIIGVGHKGPRSESGLAMHIEKNGFGNLIMLCLDCHTIVDDLENKFGVDQLRRWKIDHTARIASVFSTPLYRPVRKLMVEIDRLLDQNQTIFFTYGPFSDLAISGEGGDANKIWRRRCLDTILPNNDRIINIVERYASSFGYPWKIYEPYLEFKVHATSFTDNCLFEERINDYKTFPTAFPRLVKRFLGYQVSDEEINSDEEIEYRRGALRKIIERFLIDHVNIAAMEEINDAVFVVECRNGSRLRVFVTNNYFFTEYTYEKVLTQDPNISAIVCSNPYSSYSEASKERCITDNVGLFTLPEFMGALNFEGERFINFLYREDKNARVKLFQKKLEECQLAQSAQIYLFGSYLRKYKFEDIDLLVVYPDRLKVAEVDDLLSAIKQSVGGLASKLHVQTCSLSEYSSLKMNFDNRVRVR